MKVIQCVYLCAYPLLGLLPPRGKKTKQNKILSINIFPLIIIIIFSLVSLSKLMFHQITFLCTRYCYCFVCKDMKMWMIQHLTKMNFHAQSNFTSVIFENYSNYFSPFWSIFLLKWPIIIYYYYWAVNATLIIHFSFSFAEAEKL